VRPHLARQCPDDLIRLNLSLGYSLLNTLLSVNLCQRSMGQLPCRARAVTCLPRRLSAAFPLQDALDKLRLFQGRLSLFGRSLALSRRRVLWCWLALTHRNPLTVIDCSTG